MYPPVVPLRSTGTMGKSETGKENETCVPGITSRGGKILSVGTAEDEALLQLSGRQSKPGGQKAISIRNQEQ